MEKIPIENQALPIQKFQNLWDFEGWQQEPSLFLLHKKNLEEIGKEQDGNRYFGKFCKEHEYEGEEYEKEMKVYVKSRDEYVSVIEDLREKWKIILSYADNPSSPLRFYNFKEEMSLAYRDYTELWNKSNKDVLSFCYSFIDKGDVRMFNTQYKIMSYYNTNFKENRNTRAMLSHK